ncbi:glycosyltransferase [Conexibacter woesei]|uniref:glycosyltransferase n=1 Tax=Conexibacter woesei TaxID=191495 RepID=UPI000425181A|nr:nucleotide disphospho-sugar-binding domain-containing protein [Conexibacter woesei]
MVETWTRWREDVEREGMRFAAAPEYHVFPTRERPLKPYEAVRRAATTTRELVVAERPDVVVHDILTLAPALAAELEGVPRATLIPHLDPRGAPGWPPYSIGARLPRTGVGRAFWGLFDPLLERGLQLGRRELNETRSRLGLPPQAHVHGGISRELAIVVTFPQLEYPRAVPEINTHIVGPLSWEPPSEPVELPSGTDPLVLVAPSTAQDHEGVMLRAALAAMADLPVRVIATTNKRGETGGYDVPANAKLVDWLSYSRTMPQCDLVVCHVGHGTLMRALSNGVPVVACPAAGDMNENAARVDWAGVGIRLPRRLIGPRGLNLAIQKALADRDRLAANAAKLSHWSATHDPGATAAQLVEDLAARAT